MTNPSKRKGDVAEVEIVATLRRAGLDADTTRNNRGGRPAGVDVLCPELPVSIEVKDGTGPRKPPKPCGCPNTTAPRIGQWVDQARRQGDLTAPGAVFHKRRGRASGEEWFVTMQVDEFVELVRTDVPGF